MSRSVRDVRVRDSSPSPAQRERDGERVRFAAPVARRARAAATALLGLLVAHASAGCSSSSEDDRTVAGRSRSVTGAADAGSAAATLRLVETRDQATGERRALFEVAATITSATGAVLRTSGGASEERLEARAPAADGAPTFGLRVQGTPGTVQARFPSGAYTVVAERPDGTQPAVTLLLSLERLPPAPTILSPADLDVAVPARPLLTWSPGASTSGSPRFDVTITDAATGEVVVRVPDVHDTQLVVPASTPLAPGRRYELEVRAVSGPRSDAVRLEAGATTLFDTGTP